MYTTSLDFLYQSPSSLLTNGEMKIKSLSLMAYFIKETIDALEAFYFERRYKNFDPHVGETACQIRAYKVFLISSTLNYPLKQIRAEIKQLQKFYQLAINQLAQIQIMIVSTDFNQQKFLSKTETLGTFLSEKGLIFQLPYENLFLMRSYFLSRFKRYNQYGDTFVDFDKICSETGTSRKLAKKITHFFQMNLADDSVKFIEELIGHLPQYNYLNLAINFLKRRDDDDRLVLPCFLGMRILLAHMCQQKCPILLVINRQYYDKSSIDIVTSLYIPTEERFEFKPYDKIPRFLFNKSCVVIEGVVIYKQGTHIEGQSKYLRRLRACNLSNIILSYMANHPQYSGATLAKISNDPFTKPLLDMRIAKSNFSCSVNTAENFTQETEILLDLQKEMQNMKLLGEYLGCTENNPSLFFIRHIFCDLLEHQYETIYLQQTHCNTSYNRISSDVLAVI